MADIAALRDELLNDPLGRGYAGLTDQQAADSLNAENRTVNVPSVSGDDAFTATDPTEFAGLTDAKRSLWVAWTSKDAIDPFNSANVAFVQFIFGGGAQTITNLAALRTRTISRAEELNLLGSSDEIGPAHVARARA